jgi:thioredoxin-dependent adenylylsulfate APS reductase
MVACAMLERRELTEEEAVEEIAAVYEDHPPQDLLRWAIGCYGDRLLLATSFQVDGMAILDMAWRIHPDIRVVTVDTGRLHPETYELMDRVRERYQIPIEVYYPDTAALERLVRENGVNPFYRSISLRFDCCGVRKVEPLKRALATGDAWIAGQRRDQLATRRHIRKVELDRTCPGKIKLNPLADWSDDDVWAYVRANDVPYNALYDQGYTSIGCAPCTRPVQPGDDPRSGRWWWEENLPKECGIHYRLDRAVIGAQAAARLALVARDAD